MVKIISADLLRGRAVMRLDSIDGYAFWSAAMTEMNTGYVYFHTSTYFNDYITLSWRPPQTVILFSLLITTTT